MIEIIFGIIIGIIIYSSIVQPYAYNTCLLNSESCVKIMYKTKLNTVLMHIIPEGKTVWFNGRDILLYGEPTGRICEDDTTEPVYVFDLKTDTPKGYLCAKSLVEVQEIYKDSPSKYISVRNTGSIGIANLVDIMVSKDIISLDHL